MLPRRPILAAPLCLVLALAGGARAWMVERSVAAPSRPAILTWTFSQEPQSGPWDSLEITVLLKPGLPIGARILSWSQRGPWSARHPVLRGDSGALCIKAWRRLDPGGDDSGISEPIATLSVEVRVDSTPDFSEVEAGMRIRGFASAVTVTRELPRPPVADARAGRLRDALGRRRTEVWPALLSEWEKP